MYVFKWANLNTRMLFGPDDGGGSGGEAAPASGGGGGDSSGAGTSGGSSAPTAPPPSAPTSELASTPGGTETFDWSALGSSDDLDHHIEVPQEPPAPVAPPKEAAPPVAPAQPVPPVETPPQAAQAPQQPTAGESPPLSAADPLRIAEAIEANRDAAVAHLAQSKFALSEDEIKGLDADPASMVPRLLARVFVESQVSMQKFLAQAVPGMVKKYNTVTSANDSAEQKFFKSHPALNMNDPKHRETTVRIASLYRQANPGIPLDQLIAEVGPMVMASLKINGTLTPPQAAPSPPPVRNGGFRPAVNGGGGLSPTAAPANEWAGLGRNYDE